MMKFSVTDVCCGSCLYIYNIAQETLAPAFARGGGSEGRQWQPDQHQMQLEAELIGFSDSATHVSALESVIRQKWCCI